MTIPANYDQKEVMTFSKTKGFIFHHRQQYTGGKAAILEIK